MHRILLVMQYDISGSSASSRIARRVCPDGPMNGSLFVYSESPGASPIRRMSMNGDALGECIEYVTLWAQYFDISHLEQDCRSLDHILSFFVFVDGDILATPHIVRGIWEHFVIVCVSAIVDASDYQDWWISLASTLIVDFSV